MIQNIVLKIAYDGTDFYGWQKTNVGPSIEGVLSQTLEQILQEPIALQAASRTDRGVHAEAQVVNFTTEQSPDLWKLKGGLNALLPSTIRVLCTYKASDKFHPSLDAKQKEYHYQICIGLIQLPKHRLFSWHAPNVLNYEKMLEGASHFIGTHDFTSFCNQHENLTYKDKKRYIESIELIPLANDRIRFVVKGNHFLYKMVRNIVGTLVYVGSGKIEPDAIPTILEKRSRPLAGITAPAHGLTLKQIYY